MKSINYCCECPFLPQCGQVDYCISDKLDMCELRDEQRTDLIFRHADISIENLIFNDDKELLPWQKSMTRTGG